MERSELNYDAVMYLPGAAGRALAMVRRHPRPETLGLRYGITFHFGWVFERKRVTGAVPADPPKCAAAMPEDYDWVRTGEGVWVGTARKMVEGLKV